MSAAIGVRALASDVASWAFVSGPVVTALAAAIVVMLAVNLMSIPRLRADRPAATGGGPSVSVLVPARNEAATIERCLDALVAQDYTPLEIIVLDDRSDDDTAARVARFAGRGVRLLAGEPLPDGWTGKNWACAQLAEAAQGDVLCFVDADTVLDPPTVRAALGELEQSGAGLVTLLLATERRTLAQGLLLPMVNHALMALFPVWLMHRPQAPRVALALGPFLMVTRDAYDAAGGHAASPGHVVDDVTLARAVKQAGYPLRLANGTDLARTPWYWRTGEIWRGFAKNAFGALDYNTFTAAATVLVLVPLLCLPYVRVLIGLQAGDVPGDALVQVLLLTGARTVTSLHGRDPLWSAALHPIAVAVWGATLARSVLLAWSHGTVEWRGRDVPVRSRERPGQDSNLQPES